MPVYPVFDSAETKYHPECFEMENGEFTFEFQDAVGNKGSITAKVDTIDKTAPLELIERELEAVSHRPYNSGFYYGNLVHNHFNDGLYHQNCTFAGVALEDSKNGKVLIEQRNFFKKGDKLELVTPLSLGTSFIVEAIETEEHEPLETACHPQQILYISCGDTDVKKGDILRVRKENNE